MDVLVLAIFLFSIFACFQRGFVKSLFGMFRVFIALFIAINLALPVAGIISGFIDMGPIIIIIIAVVLVFAVAVFALNALMGVLHFIASLPIISIVNKLGGALIGLLQGYAIVFIMIAIITLWPPNEFMDNLYQMLENSRVASFFL